VAFAPEAFEEMAEGFCELASLLAVTLGPCRGPIWYANKDRVELLSNSGIVARRMVEMPDRLRNTGAMQLRHMVWRMEEYFGDGGATAAVLAQAMISRARTLVAAGIDPLDLRAGLEAALPDVLAALESQGQTAEGEAMENLIASVLSHADIAHVLAEMIDVLGNDAVIHLQVMSRPYLDRIYVDGSYWKLQPSSRSTLPAGTNELVLDTPYVLVADDVVFDTKDLVPALEALRWDRRQRSLVIVGVKLTSGAQDLLNLNVARGTVAAYAVSPVATGPQRHQLITDLALSTGAEVVSVSRGYAPRSLHPSWLGSAREAVLKRDSLIVIEGGGERSQIEQRVGELRAQIGRSTNLDDTAPIRERLACLTGSVGILQIGGLTQAERDDKRRHVERVLRVLPELAGGGFVPGGGMALLACRSVLQRQQAMVGSADQRHGMDMLARALAAPFLQIVANSHARAPESVLQQVTDADYCLAFDALAGDLVPISELAVADSLAVVRGALRLATSAVAEMITTGVVVLPKESRRQVSTEP
jgi:chaperonin GroEL